MRRRRAENSRAMRLLAANAALGGAFGAGVVGALIAGDVGGLGALLARTHQPATALALLMGGFVAMFAAASASTAVMLIPAADEEGGAPPGRLAPARRRVARRSVHDGAG